MKIIVKPMGLVCFGAIISLLVFLIIRKAVDTPRPPAYGTPAVAKATSNLDRVYLYDDALKSSWTTQYSWAKELRVNSTENVYSGKNAICSRMGPWGGIKFAHGDFDVTPFDRLVFQVNPGNNPALSLQVHGGIQEKSNAPKTWEYIHPLPPNRWTTCIVPLKDLDIAGRMNLDNLTIQEGTGKPTEPFYLDDIYLLRKGAPSPMVAAATMTIEVEK